jgi:hypothetical protein
VDRIQRQPQQPTPATGQVTDTERTRMHTQTASIADQLDTNPGAPMTENTLIGEAERNTSSVRERQYLLASTPPTYGMTQGQYAAELRAVNA